MKIRGAESIPAPTYMIVTGRFIVNDVWLALCEKYFDTYFILCMIVDSIVHLIDQYTLIFDGRAVCTDLSVFTFSIFFAISSAHVPNPFGNPAWAMTLPSFHHTANWLQSLFSVFLIVISLYCILNCSSSMR